MRLPISFTNIMLIIGVVIFVIYLQSIGVENIVNEILVVDKTILFLLIIIDVVCIGLFTLSWYVFLRNPSLKFRDCFEIVLMSIFCDLMIPTASISGEIVRINLTAKKANLQISKAATSVILHRIMLTLTFGFIIILCGLQIINYNMVLAFFLVTISIIIVITLILLLYAVKRYKKLIGKMVNIFEKFVKKVKPNFDIKIKEESLNKLENILTDKKAFISSFILLIIRWFLLALIPYIIFISMGYYVSYWIILTVSSLMSMIQIIPIGIPGMIGIMEVSITVLFVEFSIPLGIASSVAILMRIITFWFELILGLITTSIYGINRVINKTRSNNSM
ncbi:MAG: flippase-like domain-containing protein [Candidatus Verstraetearchaeota archaeon]|nr:flippase-like domain-containing protein [Candidatus Verstraetearchaeota archaeon]